jgi:SET domain-containing protein
MGRGLFVMESPLGGLGCFASVCFRETSRIGIYVGERITHTEAMQRLKGLNGKYICQLDEKYYVDGSVDGNETQYINHSCEPNADAVVLDGLIVVYALREILRGEEITVDYLNSFDEDRTICQCRSASCRKKNPSSL